MPVTSTVSSGQTWTGSSVLSGETLTVNSGGAVISTHVSGSGTLVVNGSDTSATVASGGIEIVSSGSASGDVISGVLSNVSGVAGHLSNEVIANGGVFYEVNSGIVSGTVVMGGGVLNINGNTSGANSNDTLISGGLILLASPKATVGGTLTFSGGGNTLEVSGASSGGYGDQAVITGFTSGDNIDLATLTSTAALSLSFATSGNNTIVTVTSGGTAITGDTFAFAGSPASVSGILALTSDTGGHADIKYASSSAPTGSTTTVTTPTASGAFTETSGNTLLVLNGGSVSAATIGSGGFLVISGGIDAAATVSAGGSETVSGGQASGDQIFGAATIVGGSVSSETVASGGTIVFNAAPGSATTVLAGGTETVAASGVATSDTILGSAVVNGAAAQLVAGVVSSGGVVDLYQGATSGVTVDSGGKLYISGGNTASNTVLDGGATLELGTSGSKAGGGMLVFSGGGNTLQFDKLLSAAAGDLATISGFSSTDVIVLSGLGAGATVSVATSGANDVATVAGASGSESFIFAGTSTYTNNTLFVVTSGGAVDLEYNPNPSILTVGAGVTSTGLVVSSGVTLNVLSGGTVSMTIVDNLGAENVSGADVSATIAAGGAETVFAGGSATGDRISGAASIDGAASGEIVLSGGALTVNGGADVSATIDAGGSATVTNAGTATGDAISGVETVLSANVTGATVAAGGLLSLTAGAADAATTILAGGTVDVAAASGSASLSGDSIYGVVNTVSGDAATFTTETVYGGGVLNLANSNNATGTLVLSGGTLNLSGHETATDTTLSGGGLLDLGSPKATLSGSLTFAGGGNTLEISDKTSAGYGDFAVMSGFSSTDKIAITSGAYAGPALSLTQATSGGNTVVDVISGGATVEAFTFAGAALSGYFELLSDGNGGVYLETPPVSVTTSVTTPTAAGAYTEQATDTLLVLAGGSVSAATIEGGGYLIISGGADTAATVQAGGAETISAGSATGDQIYGSAVVSGGAVTGETALSGGELSIAAGASASNTVLGGGGVVDLASPTATLTGSLTFTSGFNTLEAGAVAGAGYGDQAVISGFTTADKIDVTGISPTGATLSFSTNTAGDSVATISGAGGSESFVFSDPGAYNSETMSLLADGSGGVDLILDATPVVTFTSLGLETNAPSEIVNGTVDTSVDPEAVGTTVSVSEGNTVVGTGTVGANGYWSAKVTFLNDDGANTLTASDTDAAGNTGVTSQSLTYGVNTTAAAFTPGNLVVSISGDGDGSGQYGDNQASPITLEQVTTNGTIVSQLVLPQTTTVVNGVTEYNISGEYGSSSEGSLELSADGHSLVIAGYGVNAATFNAGGASVYGNAALAQSTSVPGGSDTPVARVIADINANGVVDTSTALYNVFNLNNPRSVATVDGSSFYVSGQGDKNPTDNEQGVFYALDGASSATVINQATDTRTAEIYDGQLYVSVDSTQGGGTTNISEYAQNGTLPTSATSPVVLQGLSNSVVLTSATENGVNDADLGTSVNLSPENFFFANADTLYVADGGAPKEGGLGDGGLQKWVYDTQTSTWNLQYTLAAGLGLVANTAGASSTGDTGLIGLTGKVVGDSVELYATTEPLNDLGATSVVAITDSLSSTTGAGESFTTVLTASPGENIRGIAFAPTAYAPTITGTVAGQTTSSEAPIDPFSGVTIADQNSQAVETLTITVGGSGGALSGTGLSGGTNGVYTLSGSPETVTGELDALSFTPTAGQPSTTSTSTFTLSDLSSADSTPTVDSTTTVIDSDGPSAPSITTLVGQPVNGSSIEVKGTGMSGDTVTLYADGGTTAVGAGTVTDGAFDITTSATFADGDHSLTATETDTDGRTSGASSGFPVAVDPAAPAITTLVGQPVNGSTIEVQGTGESGDTVTLYADGGTTAVGSGTVVNGTFDITTSATFADGNHTLKAAETDSASLTSAESSGFAVAVDPTAPAITTLVGQPVNGGTVEVKGAGESGDTVTLYADGGTTAVGSGAVVNGTFDITTSATFAAGNHTLTATETDGAGLTSTASSGFPVTVATAYTLTPGKDTIVGGPADVVISAASGTLSDGDVISPTAGQNTIALSGGGKFDLRKPKTLTNVTQLDATEGAGGAAETVYLRAGLDLTVNVASGSGAGSGITIYGAADDSTIDLGSGADSVILGGSGETVNGGSGNDTFSVNSATIGATIAGGSGQNTLIVTGGGTAAMGASITGIETVTLKSPTDFTANGLDLTITGKGNDTIQAGSGAETITGGAGSVLIAGSGVDIFEDTAAHLATDTIENFVQGDTIDITNFAVSSKKPTTATWSDGELTVTQGAKTETIALTGDFTGQFSVVSDGAKGIDITYSGTSDAAVAHLIQAMASFGATEAAASGNALSIPDAGLHAMLAAHA